ncbi:MAG: hypothetical protein ACMXYD_03275 [Candidatus Woesearchaeota archaeon]
MADVSNNTVALLLVLVIAVSALGTMAVLNAPQPAIDEPTGAEVLLTVAPPPPEASVNLVIADEREEDNI